VHANNIKGATDNGMSGAILEDFQGWT